MTIEENKAIARRHLIDVLEHGKVELIDSYYAPDGSVPDMDTPQQLRDRVLWHHKWAPGLKITILDVVAEGDRVAASLRVDLTFVCPPAERPNVPPHIVRILDKPVSYKNISMFRFAGGKLVTLYWEAGWMGLLVKEGVYTLTPVGQA